MSQNLCSLNILAFLFHTVQEFEDENYVKIRSIIGTRKEFFQTLNLLTTLFAFKDFDRLIEFILIKRTNSKNINMGEYIVL